MIRSKVGLILNSTFEGNVIMNNNIKGSEDIKGNVSIHNSSYVNEDTNALLSNIRLWAHDRNLIKGSTSKAQLCKLMEEVGELAVSLNKNLGKDNLTDAIGDCMVVLTILATQNDTSIRECLLHAWLQIKDRKGKMVDGVFIKENDQDIAILNK